MSKTIAFLRAINVGGRTVKMEHLRQLFESLGLTGVETFIASGNVVFDSVSGNARHLEAEIADQLHRSLGYPVAVFIRTEAELARISAFQAFPKADLEAAAALNIAFLAEPLDDKSERKLWALKTDIDDFAAHEREIYWLCHKKQSLSSFSNAVLERTLAVQATLRGVNTVRKMAARYAPRS